MESVRILSLAAAMVVTVTLSANAQVEVGRLQVTPYAGAVLYDGSSALDDSPIIGIDAVYQATSNIGIGVFGSYAQGESDGSFFPAMRWNVGPDTSLLIHVGQDVSTVTYGAIGKLGFVRGRLAPYVMGGIGGYTIFLDPQSNNRPERMADLMLEFGGGLHFRIAERTGLRIDVRDMIFTGFDRDDLFPVDEMFQTDVFLVPLPPEAESTIHNISLTIGFTYMAGR